MHYEDVGVIFYLVGAVLLLIAAYIGIRDRIQKMLGDREDMREYLMLELQRNQTDPNRLPD
jgi:hypothetical protein